MATENFTTEAEQMLAALYVNNKNTKSIAEQLNRSERSVIAKLVQLRVYERPKVKRMTKADLVENISQMLGTQNLGSLEKGTYPDLLALHDKIVGLTRPAS